MKKVKGQRYLYLRKGPYYFRRGVPEYARKEFGGRAEDPVSLKTDNFSEAQYLILAEIRRFETTVAEARKSRTLQISSTARFTPSIDEIEEAVRSWYSDRLARSDVSPHFEMDEVEAGKALQRLTVYAATVAATNTFGGVGSDLNREWIAQTLYTLTPHVLATQTSDNEKIVNRTQKSNIGSIYCYATNFFI